MDGRQECRGGPASVWWGVLRRTAAFPARSRACRAVAQALRYPLEFLHYLGQRSTICFGRVFVCQPQQINIRFPHTFVYASKLG